MENNERIVLPPMKRVEDPIEAMTSRFIAFLGEHDISSDELEQAYLLFTRVNEEEGNDERIRTLLLHMEQFANDGFPLNRFVELISTMRKVESAVVDCHSNIESLPITVDEKNTLHDTLNECRLGTLEAVLDNDAIEMIQIKDDAPEVIAMDLNEFIKKAVKRHTTTPEKVLHFNFYPTKS